MPFKENYISLGELGKCDHAVYGRQKTQKNFQRTEDCLGFRNKVRARNMVCGVFKQQEDKNQKTESSKGRATLALKDKIRDISLKRR